MLFQRLYDKAWEALITGNRLQSESQETGGSQDEKLLQALKAIFPVPSQQQSRSSTYEALLGGAGGCMDDSPIFVVGMPRSGSTLVEQILASHPDVAGAGDLPLLTRVIITRGTPLPAEHCGDVTSLRYPPVL